MSLSRMKAVFICLAGAAMVACVTAGDVREIVDDSNRETVVGSISAEAVPGQPGASNDAAASWQDVVNRIETFIAEHPDDSRTIAALRIREAVVLLNAGQTNLARAVFNEVDESQLGNARDRAIYDARDALLWWYGWDGTTLAGDNEDEATKALATLGSVAGPLDDSAPIARFLEETRVRIAVGVAANETDEAKVRAIVEEPLDRYASQFEPADRAAIQRWHLDKMGEADAAHLKSLRWFDYVPTPFDDVDEMLGNECPEDCLTPAWLQCIDEGTCAAQ